MSDLHQQICECIREKNLKKLDHAVSGHTLATRDISLIEPFLRASAVLEKDGKHFFGALAAAQAAAFHAVGTPFESTANRSWARLVSVLAQHDLEETLETVISAVSVANARMTGAAFQKTAIATLDVLYALTMNTEHPVPTNLMGLVSLRNLARRLIAEHEGRPTELLDQSHELQAGRSLPPRRIRHFRPARIAQAG
ncbi:MAG: hypothetical protein PHY92_04420 [Alphaproteobacteria bacterium]|nr:hypothetical protein [Alphaproteobacteria bacterium]